METPSQIENKSGSIILMSGLALTAGMFLSTFAFTRNVRNQILERDGYKCVVCGAIDHLEAAHIDHNKKNPKYNDPSNGRILDVFCHLLDHINRAGRNGLSKTNNDWAIETLQNKIDNIDS